MCHESISSAFDIKVINSHDEGSHGTGKQWSPKPTQIRSVHMVNIRRHVLHLFRQTGPIFLKFSRQEKNHYVGGNVFSHWVFYLGTWDISIYLSLALSEAIPRIFDVGAVGMMSCFSGVFRFTESAQRAWQRALIWLFLGSINRTATHTTQKGQNQCHRASTDVWKYLKIFKNKMARAH